MISSEGSPMAKPTPMVPAEARPVNLVSRSPWEREGKSSRRQENAQSSDSWKQCDQEEPSNSINSRTLVPASKSKNRVSKHEEHEPSVHDEDLPIFAKKVGIH